MIYIMTKMPAHEGTTIVLEVLWDLMLEVQDLDSKLRDLEVTDGTSSRLAELSKQRNGALDRIQEQHVVLQKQDLGAPFYTYFLKHKHPASQPMPPKNDRVVSQSAHATSASAVF